MTAPIVRQLILKDLYLVRWMILSAIVSGLVAVGIMPLGAVMAYVGGVSLICAIVILNIFLVMNAVVQERKDKVHLFILSLPVSTAQYTAAKMLSNAIAFVVPWCILTAAVALVIDVSALPNGALPFLLTVLVSRKQISCSTTLAAEDLRSWPDVVAVERDAERLRITVVDAEPVLRRLLTSDDRLSDIEVRRAGLSEAFVELTKEAA